MRPFTFLTARLSMVWVSFVGCSFLLLIFAPEVLCGFFSDKVKVWTEQGWVLGREKKGYNEFLGVPYAEPPVGAGRFRPPAKKRPWQGTWDALRFGAACVQGAKRNPDPPRNMSEDCLTLNIWQPPYAKKSSKLPVLFWIYGGAFQQGRTEQPEYLGDRLAARYDVVVVTVNYRVGALGFLVSIEDGLLGNYGLQDQRLALEWVHANVRHFGGDPDKVTLWGESAGAMSVGQQLLMGGSGRLFRAAIMQSNPFGYRYRTLTVANFIGISFKKQLGCLDLECLQGEPVNEIVRATEITMQMPRNVGDLFTWGPVVEGVALGANRSVVQVASESNVTQPIPFLEATEEFTNTVPVLLGTNRHEGEMFVYSVWGGRMGLIAYRSLVNLLFKTSAPRVLRTYKHLADPCRVTNDFRPALSAILNDYMFRCPTWRAANALYAVSSGRGRAPVYVYEFALPTRLQDFPECYGKACHTAELPFVFGQVDVIHENYTVAPPALPWYSYRRLVPGPDRERRVAEMMTLAWTNFAKTGRPAVAPGLLAGVGSGWGDGWWPQWEGSVGVQPRRRKRRSMFATERPRYLEINAENQVHFQQADCTCEFWDQTNYVY
mmetsp:Transcript_44651/g.74203  ORF Transcript_44651/g.74203 Transcript_44651/m.74203 type:complete len:604 (+) Transcript_44651:72-1883(+)